MLSESEKDYVRSKLVDAISMYDRPREVVAAAFIGTSLVADLNGGSPTSIVNQALQLCIGDAWSHDPPWLVRLIEILPVDVVDARLASIRDAVRTKPLGGPDPLSATVLDTGAPFVNRATLRGHLARLAKDVSQGQPILVVSGSSKCGKSYSRSYIEHFAYTRGSITTYPLEFEPELGLEITAEHLAQDLVSMMGRPLRDKPAPLTNAKLYAQQLAAWVLNEASQVPEHHWFVLDNYRGDRLQPSAKDFLVALSDRVTRGKYAQRCRLILIGFDRAMLSVDPGKICEDKVCLSTAAEVETCVLEILSPIGGGVAPGQLSEFVFKDLPADESRMQHMNLRLRLLIRGVRAVREVADVLPSAQLGPVIAEVLNGVLAMDAPFEELDRRLEDMIQSAREV